MTPIDIKLGPVATKKSRSFTSFSVTVRVLQAESVFKGETKTSEEEGRKSFIQKVKESGRNREKKRFSLCPRKFDVCLAHRLEKERRDTEKGAFFHFRNEETSSFVFLSHFVLSRLEHKGPIRLYYFLTPKWNLFLFPFSLNHRDCQRPMMKSFTSSPN